MTDKNFTNRLDQKLADLKTRDEKALVAFLTAGDPDLDTSLMACRAVLDKGADILELGMPFSDPMADGPAIQAANIRALAAGQTMIKTLKLARDLTASHADKPLVLMGYANPVHHYGYEKFVHDARQAGVDGLIVVDLPPEENAELHGLCAAAHIHLIPLVTPTTDAARLPTVLKRASGFIYYVAVAGITGTASAEMPSLQKNLDALKAATNLPVMTGFGIKTPADAARIAPFCEGVVVGSSLVQSLYDEGLEALASRVAALKQAL